MKTTRVLLPVLAWLAAAPKVVLAGEAGDPVLPSAGMSMGSWPDSVALALPPAPAESAPRVELVANHTTPDGVLGQGWLLSASRVISRRSATGGVPGHTSSDLYLLDGRRLTAMTGPVRYEPEQQDGSRLDYDSATNTWMMRKDGWTWIFGSKTGTGANATELLFSGHGRALYYTGVLSFAYAGGTCSVSNIKCNTAAWHLSKVTDPHGNVTKYDYQLPALPPTLTGTYWQESTRLPLLSVITYAGGNATVNFGYATRPALHLDGSAGTPHFLTQRLKTIEVKGAGGVHFSRYELSYVDEGGSNCNSSTLEADLNPRRISLLRITETAEGGGAPRHVLRCLDYAKQTTGWQSPSAITTTIDNPSTAGFNVNSDWGVPLALNLDGDGVSDLLVLGFHTSGANYSVNHRAYVATPGASAPFATSTGSATANLIAAAWENMVRSNLPASHFNDDRTYAIADIDRDTWPELFVEMQSGSIAYLHYQPATRGFNAVSIALDKCDLRWGTFVDVDGDGFLDLVRRPHGTRYGCLETTRSTWLRNSGVAPFLSNTSSASLTLPMEATSLPADFQSKLAAVCGGSVSWPERVVTGWTAAGYIGDHARYSDFNGDGLVDVAYALYGCWEDLADQGFHPIDGSAYSRIYFGDGYGAFYEAKLGAGPAFTLNTADRLTSSSFGDRIVPGFFQNLDLDGDSVTELLSTRLFSEVGVTGAYQRGLTSGFGFAPITDTSSGTPSDLGGQDINPPLSYVGNGYDCYEHTVTPAIADFDGDGFPDVLTLEYHADYAPTGCSNGSFCALMRKSSRTLAEGRLIGSTSSWGGKTSLGWSFSASPSSGNNNPDLPANLEVLASVDGAEGRTTLRYGGATISNGAPTPFSTVERVNARGGKDTFGFAITPALSERLTYATRARTDGTLEHATVFMAGTSITTGYSVDAVAPYFNPPIRQCEYELGYGLPTWWGGLVQSVDITSLISHCAGYGKSLGSGFTGQHRALTGFDLHPATSSTAWLVAERAWGRAALGDGSSIGIDGSGTTGSGTWVALATQTSSALAIGLRWSLPSELSGAMPALFAASDRAYPAGGSTTEQRSFLTDWVYDATKHTMTSRKDLRELTTSDDDLTTTFTWQQPDTAGLWFRLLTAITKDPSGNQQSSVTRSSFAFFDVPQSYVACGTSAAGCLTHRYTYFADGGLATHTRPDLAVERWTRNWCGKQLTYTDPLGRPDSFAYDGRCLPSSEARLGVTTSWTWDALRRVSAQTLTPNGGPPAIKLTTWFDDGTTIFDDSTSRGPRKKQLRGDGRLELTYMDGFGRTTRRLVCKNAGTSGGVSAAACDVLTLRAAEHNVYGTDGLPMLLVNPYLIGEIPTTRLALRDGYGRVIAQRVPAPNSPVAMWNTSRTYYRPGSHESVDAMGRSSVVTFDTLTRTRSLAGIFRGRTTLNRLGDISYEDAADSARTERYYDAYGRLKEVRQPAVSCADASGAITTCTPKRLYAYDALGHISQETLPDGTVNETSHDLVGRVTSRKIDGIAIETIVYADGNATTPSRVTRTDEAGSQTVEEYDGLDRLLSATRLGLTETRSYGNGGQLERVTDGDGLRHDYTYDIHDRVATQTEPASGMTTYTWNGGDHLKAIVDADGVQDTFTYSYAGLPFTHGRGSWVLSLEGYDDVGRPTGLIENGVRSSFETDSLGRISVAHVGLDSSNVSSVDITIGYDAADRVLSRGATPRGSVMTSASFVYNALGWLTKATDPEAGVTSVDYDIAGRPRIVTDAMGAKRVVEYDERGRVTRADLPGHGALTRSYTIPATRGTQGNLWLSETTDGDGKTTRAWVDSLDRAVAIERPDGGSTEFTYNGSHLLNEHGFDASGTELRQKRFRYDNGGRLWRTLGPDVPGAFSGTVYTIDRAFTAAGRLSSVTMPDDVTTFAYSNGYLSEERYGGLVHTLTRGDQRAPWVTEDKLVGSGQTRKHVITRDDGGRVISDVITDGSAHTEEVQFSSFDAYNSPRSEISLLDGVQQIAHTWTFDRAGRPTRRVTQTAGGPSRTTSWAWYANSVLQRVTTPSGVVMAYDYGTTFDHKLRKVHDGAGTTYADFTAWNGRGQPTSVTLPMRNVSLALGYDAMGRMTSRSEGQVAMTPTSTWTGTYDVFGRLGSEHYTDAAAVSWDNTFSYDGKGHLIEEQRGKTGKGYRYTLDLAGNRTATEVQLNGGAWTTDTTITYSGVKVASVNGVNLSYDDWSGISADQHGNTFARTPSGRESTITGGGVTTRLLRDAHGIPVGYDEGTGVRVQTFGFNAGALPLELQKANGGTSTYVQGGGLLLGRIDGGTFRVLGANQAGTLTRSNNQTLDSASAFGVGATTPADERYRFGGLMTVSGAPDVMLARLRVYDPETGRFISPDPSGLGGGPHRFMYADGDPVQKSDPMGLAACSGAQLDPHLPMLDQIAAPQLMDSGISHDTFAFMEQQPSNTPPISFDLSMLTSTLPPWAPQPCQTQGCDPTGEGSFGTNSASTDSADPDTEAGSTTTTSSGDGTTSTDEEDDFYAETDWSVPEGYDPDTWVMTPEGDIVNAPMGGEAGDIPLFDAFGPNSGADPSTPPDGDTINPAPTPAPTRSPSPSMPEPSGLGNAHNPPPTPVGPAPAPALDPNRPIIYDQVNRRVYNLGAAAPADPVETPAAPRPRPTIAGGTPVKPASSAQPTVPASGTAHVSNSTEFIFVATNYLRSHYDMPVVDVVSADFDTSVHLLGATMRTHNGKPSGVSLEVLDGVVLDENGVAVDGSFGPFDIGTSVDQDGVHATAAVTVGGVKVSGDSDDPGTLGVSGFGLDLDVDLATGEVSMDLPTALDWSFLSFTLNGDGTATVSMTSSWGDDILGGSVTMSITFAKEPGDPMGDLIRAHMPDDYHRLLDALE